MNNDDGGVALFYAESLMSRCPDPQERSETRMGLSKEDLRQFRNLNVFSNEFCAIAKAKTCQATGNQGVNGCLGVSYSYRVN